MTVQQVNHDLTGQHVVVVGGSSGIGLAIAAAASAAGAGLTLLARDPDKLRAAAMRVGNAEFGQLDLRRGETIAAALANLRPLDHLVVTAGSFGISLLADLSPEDWRGILEERLIGPLTLVKLLAPRIASSIVFFSGTVSHRPSPGVTVLAAATAGIEGATRALALELAPIRVNAVVPGMVDTPMLDKALATHKEQVCADMAATLPTRHVGTAADIAAAALFLMTNPYVTGTAMSIDGGALLI